MDIIKSFARLTIIISIFGNLLGEEGGAKHLFILSGQSNMAGLDPATSFTPTVQEAYGAENAVVIKDAQGGQPIRRWYKDWKPAEGEGPEATGDLYDRMLGKVKPLMKPHKFKTVTFVWMQGERDAKEKHGEVYQKSMRGLIDQLAKDLGREKIHFVIGRLSDFDMNDKRYPHWTMVRKAQVATAEKDELGAWVDTDDLNDKPGKGGEGTRNDLHYTKEGYKILGKRFADAAIDLIGE